MLRRWPCARSLLALAALLVPATALAGGSPLQAGKAASPRWRTLLAPPTVRSPAGIAIDLRGNPRQQKWAYVADAATQRIVKFGTGGSVLGSWHYGDVKSAGTAASLAVGGSGNVFVADPGAGRVLKFSPAGKLLARWSGFEDPRGIAVDGTGDIYVAEYAARRVTKLSPSGAVLVRWATRSLWPPGGPSNPTGVALSPPDSLYVSTTCTIRVTCSVGADMSPQGDMIDGILEFLAGGPRQGYLMENWFGSGHSAAGVPDAGQSREAEPFVTIESVASDRKGNLYVAGLLWPLGARPARGVLAYTPIGYKWARWNLPSQSPVHGVAIDGRGAIYVSQGNRVLKLAR